jgi:hypothetical protein
LLLCFDAFRGGYHVEALGEAGHGMHDGKGLGSIREVLDEGAIDLDLVEGEAAQVAHQPGRWSRR